MAEKLASIAPWEANVGRRCYEQTADQAVDFAFDHIEELARLLHGSGHRDMAALLDGMGDLRELSRRRIAQGGDNALLAPSTETLDYVLAQMAELAELMTRKGVDDAAMLFRVPGQLRNACEMRQRGERRDDVIHLDAVGRSPFHLELRPRRQEAILVERLQG